MRKVEPFSYAHLPLAGETLTDAIKMVLDEMVKHYNENVVAQINNEAGDAIPSDHSNS